MFFKLFFWFVLLFVYFNRIGFFFFLLVRIFVVKVVCLNGLVFWRIELLIVVKIFLWIKDVLMLFGILYRRLIDGVRDFLFMLWFIFIKEVVVGIIDFFLWIVVDIVVFDFLNGIFVLLLLYRSINLFCNFMVLSFKYLNWVL